MNNLHVTKNASLHLVSELCNPIKDSQSDEQDVEIGITLSVNGQLITGTVTSKEKFLQAKENKILDMINQSLVEEFKRDFGDKVKNSENEISIALKNDLTKDELDTIPTWFFDEILYLRNAHYISGSTFVPNQGTTIQVRISDVTSFSLESVSY